MNKKKLIKDLAVNKPRINLRATLTLKSLNGCIVRKSNGEGLELSKIMNDSNKTKDSLSGSSKVEIFMQKKNKKVEQIKKKSTNNILEEAENINQANC